MRCHRSVGRLVPAFAVSAAGLVALVLPVAAPSAPAGPAFPPGIWCGSAKAPVGKTVTIGGIHVTLDKGTMEFILASEKRKVAGDSTAESVLNTHGKLKAGGQTVTGQFRFVGDFELSGPADEPQLTGTWHITGVLFVNKQEVPFKQNVKATRSSLVIDFLSVDLAKGRWASAVNTYVGWKWTAHRPKLVKGEMKC